MGKNLPVEKVCRKNTSNKIKQASKIGFRSFTAKLN